MFKKRLSIVLDAITHHLRQNLRSLRRDAGTATLVPARRAARLDPMEVIRADL